LHIAPIELTWIGQQRFLGVDSTGHTVVLSPGADIGVKPAETLLIALAAARRTTWLRSGTSSAAGWSSCWCR